MAIYLLNNEKLSEATNLPIYEITFLTPQIDLSRYNSLIFTSKYAIKGLCDIANLDNIDCYVIASKTAKILKDYNANIKYIGKNSYGDEFANELAPLLKNKKVLYVRGKKVVSNLFGILKDNNILVDEAIVYETKCANMSQNIVLEKGSTIIFSSPSTIKCFLKRFSWDKSFKAICIGKTTASYLPDNITYQMPDSPSLAKCVQLAKRDKNV